MYPIYPKEDAAQRRGAAAVEFAVILPIFLMIVWGIIEFGRAMMAGQLLTNAARHGARLAILDGSSNSSVEAEVENFLIGTIGSALTPSDISVTYEIYRSGSLVGTDLSAAVPKDHITLLVQVSYSKIRLMPVRWLNGVQLKGRCTMRHE